MKKCPNCGSTNIGLLAVPCIVLRWLGCRDCNAEWPSDVKDPKKYMIIPESEIATNSGVHLGGQSESMTKADQE